MNLGKNIQHLRKQKKITQEQLAEMMSVSARQYRNGRQMKLFPNWIR